MATTISTQDIVDAKRDINDIGKAVNEKVIVSPRYGKDFKSLPMITAEFQDAINTIVIDDGVPDLAVSTWSGRTQSEKNKDSIHVLDFKTAGRNDQQAIQDAVAYCYTNNRILNWGGANLTSTANITDMWKVTHIGDGSVTRGGNTFYFQNRNKTSNLFVNTVANSDIENDGLDVANSIYPSMINTLFDNFVELNGDYVFNFAAGNYVDVATHRILLGSNSETEKGIPQLSGYIIFKGPAVGFDSATNATPTPLTQFGSDAGNQSAIAFNLRGFNALVKDIRFAGYIGSASSAAVSMISGVLICQNVHGYRNTYDINAAQYTYLTVIGGILDGGATREGVGIRSIFTSKHNIGSQGNAASQTPIIRNKNIGFISQEGATGHSDFVTYNNCNIGIQCVVNARVNTNGSSFANSSLGVSVRDGGNVYMPSNVTFKNCSENVSVERGDLITNTSTFIDSKYEALIRSNVTRSSTSGTDLKNILEVQVPTWWSKVGYIGSQNVGKKLRFVVHGNITGTGGTKQLRLHASNLPSVTSGSYIVNVATEADAYGNFKAELTITFAQTEYVSTADMVTVYGTNKQRMILNRASTIDFSSKVYIALIAGVSNATDVLHVDKVDVYAVI